jgi:hypothetical protein
MSYQGPIASPVGGTRSDAHTPRLERIDIRWPMRVITIIVIPHIVARPDSVLSQLV